MLQRLKNYSGQIWLAAKHDPILVALLVMAATYFLLYYITDPARPAGMVSWFGWNDYSQYPLGWFGFHDQGSYLQLAHTLANFDFNQLKNVYSYGLGYPLVAVPALWLGLDNDPFVFFNLFVFVFAIFAVYRLAYKLISPTAGWMAGFGLLFATPLIKYTDQPWNSTVCLLAMSGLLLVLIVKKINKWYALIAGLLVGWAFAARYVDVVWLGPLALASLYRGSYKHLAKLVLFVGIGFMLWAVPVGYSHHKVFGSVFRTPYMNHLGVGGVGGSDQQLGAYKLSRIPDAATGMFLGPRLENLPDTDRGLLVDMFWVLAAIPGAFIILRRQKTRIFFGTLIATTVLAFIFYLSFRASTPYSLKYGVLHYFKMFWPGIVILAVAFFDHLIKLATKNTKPSK